MGMASRFVLRVRGSVLILLLGHNRKVHEHRGLPCGFPVASAAHTIVTTVSHGAPPPTPHSPVPVCPRVFLVP